jgi:hypothetical protein
VATAAPVLFYATAMPPSRKLSANLLVHATQRETPKAMTLQ